MKYLSTRICNKPKVKFNKYYLSYDSEIWSSTYKLNRVKELYFDQYGCTLNDENMEHFQPKDSLSLNYFEEDFYPCILKVDNYEEWIKSYGFEPRQDIYESSNLISIGYDVMDTIFISASSHGIYSVNKNFLNEFNLFNSADEAQKYVDINNIEIPQHNWKLVQLFVNKDTYHYLRNLVNKISVK